MGAFVGFLLGGGTGMGIGAAAGLALAAMSSPDAPKGVLTPDRKRFYESAMAGIESAEKLLEIAEAFDAEELHAHAELLRRKAELRKLSPEAIAQRQRIFLRCLASSKQESIEKMAANYRFEGALVAARALMRHLDELRAINQKTVTPKIVDSFKQKLDMVLAVFEEGTKEATSAQANLDAAIKAAPVEAPQEPTATAAQG